MTTAPAPDEPHAADMPKIRSRLLNDPRHGPLPPLLLMLTVVPGLVDAVSIFRLGRVFVANMTGNVVFTGFALVGAPGFSLSASLSALAGFLVAAGLYGSLSRPTSGDRALVLLAAVGSELVLVAVALVIPRPAPWAPRGGTRWRRCWRWPWERRTRPRAGWRCPT